MKTVSNANQVGLLVEFPADGMPLDCNHLVYWATEYKNTVLHHSDGFFPDVTIQLNSDGLCRQVLFYKNNTSGDELASQSISIRDGAKIPRREVKRLQAVIEKLHAVSQSSNCSPAIASFLREFRLPNPNSMPDAWRVSPNEKKLIVLWGYTKGGSLATFLPASQTATDAKWNDSSPRLPLESVLQPYSTGFYMTPQLKMFLCGILVLILLIWGLCCRSSSRKDPQNTTETVENGNTDVTPAENGKAQPTADNGGVQPAGEDDKTANGMLNQAGKTVAENNGAETLKDNAGMPPRPERNQVIQELERKAASGAPLTKDEKTKYQKYLLKNLEDDMETLRRLIDDDINSSNENEQKLQQASKAVATAEEQVAKDSSVPQEIRSDIKDDSKREDVKRKVDERIRKGNATNAEKAWRDSVGKQEKLKDDIQKDNQKRSERIGDTIRKTQKSREQAMAAGAIPGKPCPECGSIQAKFSCMVQSFDNSDNYCTVTLKFNPGCKAIRNLNIDYFKVGYLFKRDFSWNPNNNTLNFKLKSSEIKDGKLRLLATARYTHAEQVHSTEFSLTLTIDATQKITIDKINVTPR